MVQRKQIQLGTMRLWVRSLTSLSGLKIQRCPELWYKLQTWLRSGIAVALCRLAVTAQIGPLAWEPSFALGVALKWQKTKYIYVYKIYVSVYIYICVCVCIYTHTHTHTHTLIQRKENLIRPTIIENIWKVSKVLSEVHQNPYHIFLICWQLRYLLL